MLSSRLGRLGASVLLSLVIVAASGATALAVDPVDPAPSPSDSPTVTVAPSPSDSPTVTVAPSASPSASPSPSPSADPAAPTPATTSATDLKQVVCLPSSRGANLPAGYCMTADGPKPTGKAAAASPAGPGPAATTGGYSVSGNVTAAGHPLANVFVALGPVSSCYGCYYDLYNTRTDADGNYSITDVMADTYKVMFFGDEFTYLNGYYSGTGFTTDKTAAAQLDLSSGDATDIDVQLQVGNYIQGIVRGTGAVPVGGVYVSAEAGTGLDDTYYASATSAPTAGTYSIPVPANGSYILYFDDQLGVYLKGYYTSAGTSHFTTDSASASYVDVVTSDVTGKDVQLGTGYYVTGTVTKLDATPVLGIHVFVFSSDYSMATTTKAGGTYSADVPPGDYTVMFLDYAGSYMDGYYDSDAGPGKFTTDEGQSTAVHVGASNVPGISVKLPAQAHIAGTVSGVSGPLEGVLVSAYTTGDVFAGDDTTAADGTYSLTVSDGQFILDFNDGNGAYLKGYYNGTGPSHFTVDSDLATAVVVSGGDRTGVDVQLGEGIHIQGTVTGTGAPLAGMYVAAYSSDTYWSYTHTDADGKYSITVTPDVYNLYFEDEGDVYISCYYLSSAAGHCTLPSDSAQNLTVVADDLTGKDVEMPKGHLITGTVSGTSGPLENVWVEAADWSIDQDAYMATGSDGIFSLFVAPGDYTLWFTPESGRYLEGYYKDDVGNGNFTLALADHTTVTVTTDDAGPIAVQLGTGHYVGGTVTGSTGPLEGISVDIGTGNIDDYMGAGSTDVDGNYSVPVPDGGYRISYSGYPYLGGYYSASGLTEDDSTATVINVSGADVSGKDIFLPAPPGKPTAVHGTALNASVLVSWTAPADNGGMTITGYTVTATPDGVQCSWSGTGPLSCTATGLTNGQPYTLTVTATNHVGDGPESDPSAAVTPLAGNTYHPVSPVRLLDTRYKNGLPTKLTAGVPRTFQITGRGGPSNIPAGATAITVNATSVNSTAASSIYLGPSAIAHPATYSLSFNKGQIAARGVTVALGPTGTLSVTYMAASGTCDLVLDVSGYFSPSPTDDTYHPLTPARLVDTRVKNGVSGKIKAGVPVTFAVWNRGGVPKTAKAVTGNLTVVNSSAPYALYMGPNPVAKPVNSTINFLKGQIVANSLTVPLSTKGTLSVTYLASGGNTTDFVFDVTGYYTADASGYKYVPLQDPAKILDTRTATGVSGKFSANTPRPLLVRGVAPIPASATGITAVVSVTNQTSNWAVYVGPINSTKPTTSSLNFLKGDVCSNGATVALTADGKLWLTFMAPAGNKTDIVMFVSGYFVPSH